MSRLSCEEARELAPEFALGVIAGDERARVVGHVATCGACRRLVEDLAGVADSLLLLAPDHEPPAGFENDVLVRMRRPPRRRTGRAVAVAAALLLGATIAGGGVWWWSAADREIAAHYRHALAEANGKYFGVHAVVDPAGAKVGNVFVYTGDTDWVFVVFEQGLPLGIYSVKADMKNAPPANLQRFELSGQERTWGRDLSIDLRDVTSLRFRAPDDRVLIARF